MTDSKINKAAIQEALWEAVELQMKAFTLRIKDDLENNLPTDAATLNAITAAAKVHGVTLNTLQEDGVAKQQAALAALQSLDASLANRMKPLDGDRDDEIRRLFN